MLFGALSQIHGLVRLDRLTLLSLLLRAQHLTRYRHEHLFDVDVVLGRCLEELYAHLRGETLSIFGEYDLLTGLVILVTYQNPIDYIAIVLNFVQPSFNIGKRVAARYVVNDDNAVSTPVVRRRYRSESLLSRGVPYL